MRWLILIIILTTVIGIAEASITIKEFEEWSFDFLSEDTYIDANIYTINKTHIELSLDDRNNLPNGYKWYSAVCNINGVDSLKYMNEDNQGGFNYSTAINLNYGYLPFYGLPNTWCVETNGMGYVLFSSGSKNDFPAYFRIILPQTAEHFKFYAGDGTVVIDSTTGNSATAESHMPSIVKDSYGRLHVAYLESGSELGYSYSDDNGTTWTSKALTSSNTLGWVGINIDSTDKIYITYFNDSGSDTFEFITSIDRGNTWGERTVAAGMNIVKDYEYPSCDIDNNDILWCCIVETTDDIVYYVNSTNWNTTHLLDNSQFSLACDVSIDIDGCVYMLVSSSNNLTLFSDCTRGLELGKGVSINNTFVPTGTQLKSMSLKVKDGEIFVPFGINSDLYYFYSNNGYDFDYYILTADSYETPDIVVDESGNIYILAYFSNDIDLWNSSNKGITWSSQEVDGGSYEYVSAAQSNFPVSNRVTDLLHFVISNELGSGLKYINYSIIYLPPSNYTTFTVAFPSGTESIVFNSSRKFGTHLPPANQTDGQPILTVTNNGNVNSNVSLWINTTLETGFELFYDTDNNPSGATDITTTRVLVVEALAPSASQQIWLWTNFSDQLQQEWLRNMTIAVNQTD